MVVRVTSAETYNSHGCKFQLKIHEGPGSCKPLLARYCGFFHFQVLSSANNVFVEAMYPSISRIPAFQVFYKSVSPGSGKQLRFIM